MNNIFTNLKLIFLNFKLPAKKALLNSYPQIVSSNEIGVALIGILALMSGLINTLTVKFLPIKLANTFDKSLAKYNLDGIGNLFGEYYSPSLSKYFFLGIILFIIPLLICGIIGYGIKTNFFKSKENFAAILKISALPLLPSIILFFLSSIVVSFSLVLYIIFLALGIITFIIYLYNHLGNLTENSKDKLCFISSVSVVILSAIIFETYITMMQ